MQELMYDFVHMKNKTSGLKKIIKYMSTQRKEEEEEIKKNFKTMSLKELKDEYCDGNGDYIKTKKELMEYMQEGMSDLRSSKDMLDDMMVEAHTDLVDDLAFFYSSTMGDKKLASVCLLKCFTDYANNNYGKDLNKFFDTEEWHKFKADSKVYLRDYKNYSREYNNFIKEFIGTRKEGNLVGGDLEEDKELDELME